MSDSTAVVRSPVSTGGLVAREQSTTSVLATDQARELLAPMLGKGVTLERIRSEYYFAVQANPELAECTPESILLSVAKAVREDLTIGELMHLVVFNTKVKDPRARDGERWEKRCQPVRDYKGDMALLRRVGIHVHAENIYEHETFSCRRGMHPDLTHEPILDPKKRGRLIGAYAWARLGRREDDVIIITLSAEEIDTTRKKLSKKWKEGALDAITWYPVKTCIHRLKKMVQSDTRYESAASNLDSDLPELGDGDDDAPRLTAGEPAAPDRQITAPVEDPPARTYDAPGRSMPASPADGVNWTGTGPTFPYKPYEGVALNAVYVPGATKAKKGTKGQPDTVLEVGGMPVISETRLNQCLGWAEGKLTKHEAAEQNGGQPATALLNDASIHKFAQLSQDVRDEMQARGLVPEPVGAAPAKVAAAESENDPFAFP